jgi:hypothetical protein|tara:strand:- start:104 stop:685 length:582 start_codon:yes stop_codon:yes gene_type:complete
MKDSVEDTLGKIEQYFSILRKVLSPDEMSNLENSDIGRLAICPRGLTVDDGGEAGALIAFSLQVALKAKALASAFGVDPKSIVKVSLLHELGKMGHLSEESRQLYLEQDSDWHREKLGQNYKYNPGCSRMNIGHRTLWMLSSLGINLNQDEFVAVLTSQGFHLQENSFYASTAPPVACLLQASRLAVISFSEA